MIPHTEAETGSRSRFARWWSAALMVYLTVAIVFNEKSEIGIVLANKQFNQQAGLAGHYTDMGLLVTMMLFTFGLSMVFWGRMIDKNGVKRASIWALTCVAVSNLLFASSHSFGMLLGAQFLLGSGAGFYYPVAFSVAGRWFPRRERSFFVSWIYISMSLGGAVFGPLTASLITHDGWRSPFLLFAALSVALMACYIWVLGNDPEGDRRVSREELEYIRGRTGPPPKARETIHQSVRSLSQDYRYWMVALVLLANNVVTWGYFAWAPSYFVHDRHFSLFAAAATISILALVQGIVLNSFGGWLQDRTDRRAVIAAVSAGLVMVSMGLGLALKNPFLSAFFFVFTLVPSGQMGAASQAMSINLVERKIVGTGTGLMNTVTQTLTAFAPAAMGAIIGAAGGAVGAGFLLIIGMGIVGGGAAIILARQGF